MENDLPGRKGEGLFCMARVTVSLDLSINSEANGTPHTKAIDMPLSVADTKIQATDCDSTRLSSIN